MLQKKTPFCTKLISENGIYIYSPKLHLEITPKLRKFDLAVFSSF